MNRLLLLCGVVLFLLGLLVGLGIPAFLNPRAGLAAHLEGVMNGTFLLVVGAIWSQVQLGPRQTRAAQGLLLYGTFTNFVATTLGAIFGSSRVTPIAGAGHSAAPAQELVVMVLLVSVGLTMIAGVGLLVYGLRKVTAAAPSA